MRPAQKLFKRGDEHASLKKCKFCQRLCRLKTIGHVCVRCIQKVPNHVPDMQIVKYLKARK